MWRRLRRRLRWIALGLLALIVVVAAAVLIAVHTDWGRERIRRRAVAALRAAFPGGASIGGLDGSVLGDVVLRDVVLCDATGRPAITARRVRMNLGYLALLRGELELETLDVDGVVVRIELPPGRPSNLAAAYHAAGPRSWDVGLRRVRIRDVEVSIDRGGHLEHLDHLALDGEIDVAAAGPIGARVTISGTARERAGAAIAIAGQGWLDDRGAVVPRARVALGEAAIDVHALSYRRGGAIRGAIDVRALELVHLWPARDLPLSAVDAHLAVDLALAPGAVGLAAVAGDVAMSGRAVVAGIALDGVHAAAQLTGGVVQIDAGAHGPGGAAVVARARLQVIGDDLEIHGTVDGRDLAHGDLRLGEVSIDIDVAGRPRALVGSARLTARRLVFGDQRLAELAAIVRGSQGGPLDVQLEASDPGRAAHATLAARVTLRPPGALATIAIGDYRVELAGARVEGGGGVVTLAGDRIEVHGVRLRAAGARFAVEAVARRRRLQLALDVRGPGPGALAVTLDVTPPRTFDDPVAWTRLERAAIRRLDVRAHRLDLARLLRLAGQAPTVAGTIDGELALGPTRAELAVHGHALIVAGAPAPLDLDVDLDLADPVTTRITARALRDVARATVTALVRLPRRPFDVAAWRALDRRAVRVADITVDAVDVDATMARRLGVPGLRGQLSAALHVEPGVQAATLHVTGRDLLVGPLVVPAAIAVDAAFDGRSGRATFALGLGGAPIATGELGAPIDVARLIAGHLDAGAVALIGAVHLTDTPIATITHALAGDGAVRGTVRGEATVGGTLAAPTAVLALAVRDLGVGRRRSGASPGGVRELTIDARYQAGALHATMAAAAVDGGTLAVVADLDPARPAAARLSVTATRFQLAPLARLAPTRLLGVRGILDADLQLHGLSPAAGQLAGTARITGGQAPLADAIGNLRDATVEVGFEPGRARLTAAGAVEGGRVEVVATARLRGLLPDTAQLEVTVHDLTLVTVVAPHLDGGLHVDVTRDRDTWRAVARVHDAAVEVPAHEGRELHPAGTPADLIFTSDLRPGRALPRSRATALRDWLGARPTRPWLEVDLVIDPVTMTSGRLGGELTGRLQLALGDDGASVDGRVGMVRGNAVLFDRRYAVQRADLAFDGSLDPLLDVQLEYAFRQLTMRVAVGGRLSTPTITLSSSPNTYTEGQLLAILVGGVPGNPGNQDSGFVTGVAAGAVSQLVGGFFTRRLPIRIDVLDYEAVTGVSSGAFVVGRWITSSVLVLVRTRIEARPDENVTEGDVQLWLDPRLLLEGSAGDRGVLGADLLWNPRW